MGLIIDPANNTRTWGNSGYTLQEIFEKFKKPYLMPLPAVRFAGNEEVGKNDPCPCDSGRNIRSVAWVRMGCNHYRCFIHYS